MSPRQGERIFNTGSNKAIEGETTLNGIKRIRTGKRMEALTRAGLARAKLSLL